MGIQNTESGRIRNFPDLDGFECVRIRIEKIGITRDPDGKYPNPSESAISTLRTAPQDKDSDSEKLEYGNIRI